MSVDGGATWARARLRGPNVPGAWVRWELPWTPRAGLYELLARACDEGGAVQPVAVPFNEGGYQFWAVVRHPVASQRVWRAPANGGLVGRWRGAFVSVR